MGLVPTYIYMSGGVFSHYPFTVYFLFFLDTLQTAFATHYAWYVVLFACVTQTHWFITYQVCAGWGLGKSLCPQHHTLDSCHDPALRWFGLVCLFFCFFLGSFSGLNIPTVALLVQGFFCWRIWMLAQGNKMYYVPILSLIGAVSDFIPPTHTLSNYPNVHLDSSRIVRCRLVRWNRLRRSTRRFQSIRTRPRSHSTFSLTSLHFFMYNSFLTWSRDG